MNSPAHKCASAIVGYLARPASLLFVFALSLSLHACGGKLVKETIAEPKPEPKAPPAPEGKAPQAPPAPEGQAPQTPPAPEGKAPPTPEGKSPPPPEGQPPGAPAEKK